MPPKWAWLSCRHRCRWLGPFCSFLADLICVFFTIAWALSRLNTVGFQGSYFWTQISFLPWWNCTNKAKESRDIAAVLHPLHSMYLHIFKFWHQILVQLAYEFGANIQKYESDNEVCTEMYQYFFPLGLIKPQNPCLNFWVIAILNLASK